MAAIYIGARNEASNPNQSWNAAISAKQLLGSHLAAVRLKVDKLGPTYNVHMRILWNWYPYKHSVTFNVLKGRYVVLT